ncbi:hypothetical protein [Fusobacterium sp. THCT1E2]
MFYKVENNKLVGFFLEKEKKGKFYEITEEDHEILMKGQEAGKEIIFDGKKLILVEMKSAPSEMIKPEWNTETREWEETADLKDIEKYFMDRIQEHMDKKAKTYGFDNVVTASTYLDSKVERFRNDSRMLLDWRDSIWDKAYSILENVLSGKREIPTLEELFKELPQLEDGGK